MDLERKRKVTCEYCDKEFSNPSARNKHMFKFHGESTSYQARSLVICPICTIEEKFSNYNLLNKHLSNNHNITITESVLHFSNFEEFITWRSQENREVDYACQTKSKLPNGNETIYYICNRSDYKGYISKAQKRNAKIGGSIRIHGVCPSRYIVKAVANGPVTVTFIETHVGHSDELRNKRLTKAEEETIVTKLKAGITNERIISDARQIENKTLARVNLFTRGDLKNLIRKHNIDEKRHVDDMTATTLKIEEWNSNDKKHAFFFKKIDVDVDVDGDDGPLRIDEPSTSLIRYQDDVEHFIDERSNNNPSLTKEQKEEINLEEMVRRIKNFDDNALERFKEIFKNFTRTLEQEDPPSKKRKIDKQTYYPNKK